MKSKKRLPITCCSPGTGASGKEASKHTSGAMMLDPQGKGAPGEEGNTPEVTAGPISTNTQQVQGGASVSPPVAPLQPPATTATEDEDESEDESEILEESPCGRWQKRREEVRHIIFLYINQNSK